MKPKAKPAIHSLVREFGRVLDASGFPQEVKDRAPDELRRRVQEFLDHPENRGRKRAKREPMRRARKTMKHLTHAVSHACDHVDPNVRTKAKALVRSTQHESFDVLEQRAGKFNGHLRKSGRRREEQRRRNVRARIAVGDWELVEVNSVPQLKSEGRKLSLCVAHSDDFGREYHDELRNGESEFWSVRRRGEAQGLLRIDKDTRKVVESAGRRNGPLKWKRKVACGVLRVLDATADDHQDAFSRVGAFSGLLNSRSRETTPIELDGVEYRVWLMPAKNQIAIEARRPAKFGDGRKGRRRWSLFERYEPPVHPRQARRGRRSPIRWPGWREGCSHRGAMSIGEFADLLLRCPEIAERIREAF